VVEGDKKPTRFWTKIRNLFPKGSTPRIVRQLADIVDLFLGAFLLILILSVLALLDCKLLCEHLDCTSAYHKRVCPYTEWKIPDKSTRRGSVLLQRTS